MPQTKWYNNVHPACQCARWEGRQRHQGNPLRKDIVQTGHIKVADNDGANKQEKDSLAVYRTANVSKPQVSAVSILQWAEPNHGLLATCELIHTKQTFTLAYLSVVVAPTTE